MSVSISIPYLDSPPNETSGESILTRFEESQQRNLLFYEETIEGYVKYESDEKFTDNLLMLQISVLSGKDSENDIVNISIAGDESEEDYVIHELTLSAENVVFEGEHNGKPCIIWKFKTLLIQPRRKYYRPVLSFTCWIEQPFKANGTIQENSIASQLEDYKPFDEINLLSELNNRVIKGRKTQFNIPETCLLPKARSTDQMERLVEKLFTKGVFQIPVSTLMNIKLKVNKAAGRNEILFINLGLESTEEIQNSHEEYRYKIEDISISQAGTKLEECLPFDFPVLFSTTDAMNLAYKMHCADYLEREVILESKNDSFKSINIEIKLTIQFLNEEVWKNMGEPIITKWLPTVASGVPSPPINSSLKSPQFQNHFQTLQLFSFGSSKSVANLKKASSNSLYPNKSLNNSGILPPHPNMFKTRPIPSPSVSSVTVNLNSSNASGFAGLKLTFQGSLSIKIGEVNEWKIQAVNTLSNKLSLSLITLDTLGGGKSGSYQGYAASWTLLNPGNSLICSRYQLYQLFLSLRTQKCGYFILDNDINIGNLDPHAVYEVPIRILGVRHGIFNLDGMKIFDNNTREGLEFGKLLEIFVI